MLGFRAVPLRQKTLESTYRDGTINISTTTGSFARMGTHSATDARQRVGIAGELVSFLKSPFRNQGHITSRVGVGRTSHHAGEIGVQPIPVDLFVFVPFQQDGVPRVFVKGAEVAARSFFITCSG
jgi:hypothetical protein